MQKKRRSQRSGIVTLITDFGIEAEYAGAMKGAILAVNPKAQVVDVTHQIPPHDILRASFVLKNSYSYYPKGTVHVVVVDPGVGTARRPLIAAGGGHFFVGPDNGVLDVSTRPKKWTAYEITHREFFRRPFSSTFHGRDLFGPVAGHLSLGKSPRNFGPQVYDCQRVEWPSPKRDEKRLTGQILWADPFGNLITNVSRDGEGLWLNARPWLIRGKNWRIERLSQTYGDGESGKPLALFGSSGFLELSVNRGRASDVLKIKPGDPLVVQRR